MLGFFYSDLTSWVKVNVEPFWTFETTLDSKRFVEGQFTESTRQDRLSFHLVPIKTIFLSTKELGMLYFT